CAEPMPKTAPSSVLAKMLGTPKGSRMIVISSVPAAGARFAGWAAMNRAGMSATRRTTGRRRLSIANLLDRDACGFASSCGAPRYVVSVKERFVRSREVGHGFEGARGAGAGRAGGSGAGDGRDGH